MYRKLVVDQIHSEDYTAPALLNFFLFFFKNLIRLLLLVNYVLPCFIRPLIYLLIFV